MKFNKNGGFTLVELIVVIAILAILAGVAVPAYSGYIERAERASDLQLLSAVNQAFGAACMEQNVDSSDLEGLEFVMTAEGKINGFKPHANVVSRAATVNGTALYESFAMYYGTNMDVPFKVFKVIRYSNGSFSGYGVNDEIVYTYAGSTIQVSVDTLQKLTNSTYGQKIGASTLLGQVSSLADLATDAIAGSNSESSSVLGEIVMNEAYLNNLANSLGMDLNTLLEKLEKEEDGGASFLSNSLVLSAAQSTTGKTTAQVSAMLTDPNFVKNMGNKLNDSTKAQEGLADAALAYGMYTSYVYARGDEQAIAELGNITDFTSLKSALNAMSSDDFANYLENEGKADMDAYLSAMDVISGTTESPDALNSALTNGFSDSELQGLLGGMMGK